MFKEPTEAGCLWACAPGTRATLPPRSMTSPDDISKKTPKKRHPTMIVSLTLARIRAIFVSLFGGLRPPRARHWDFYRLYAHLPAEAAVHRRRCRGQQGIVRPAAVQTAGVSCFDDEDTRATPRAQHLAAVIEKPKNHECSRCISLLGPSYRTVESRTAFPRLFWGASIVLDAAKSK